MKWPVLLFGFIDIVIVITQLTFGQLVLATHNPRFVKLHQHFGYLTVVVTLLYIVVSMLVIASSARRPSRRVESESGVDL